MEGELILTALVGSVVSLIGMIIVIQLSTRNWFKKQKYKNDLQFMKKQQDLQIKQLAKQLNVPQNTGSADGKTPLQGDLLTRILPLAKNLPREKVYDFVDRVIDGDIDLDDLQGGEFGDLAGMFMPLIEGYLKSKNEGSQQSGSVVFES